MGGLSERVEGPLGAIQQSIQMGGPSLMWLPRTDADRHLPEKLNVNTAGLHRLTGPPGQRKHTVSGSGLVTCRGLNSADHTNTKEMSSVQENDNNHSPDQQAADSSFLHKHQSVSCLRLFRWTSYRNRKSGCLQWTVGEKAKCSHTQTCLY